MFKRVLFIVCFTFISFLPLNMIIRGHCTSNNTSDKDTSFLKEELNDSILFLALNHYEVKHPSKVLAQAKLESDNFKSSLYKRKNNFLGLYNSKRKQYFNFKHWTDCIKAYKSMIEYRKREGENHYRFLQRIKYAQDPRYIERVKQIERKLQWSIAQWSNA